MRTKPSDAGFLNVDLDFKSRADPTVLVRSWDRRVLTQYVNRSAGAHWLRFNLPLQPKNPGEAIKRFAKLAATLPVPARRIWSRASKEMDIGIQAGTRGAAEWVLDRGIVRTLADLGVRVRITVYSPSLPTERVPRLRRHL